MPWDNAGAKRHTHKANTPGKQARWSATANAILKKTGDEGKAIRIANSKMAEGGTVMKQRVGRQDTKHGLLDLPVYPRKAMKKPKMRFGSGGFIETMKKGLERVMNKPKEEKKEEAPARPAPSAPSGGIIERAVEAKKAQASSGIDKMEGKKKGGLIRCRDGCAVRGKTRGRMI